MIRFLTDSARGELYDGIPTSETETIHHPRDSGVVRGASLRYRVYARRCHLGKTLGTGPDGRVLFCYGDRASDPGKKGIEAMISADAGETWSEPVRLIYWNGLDGGYPSSVQRADGQIVTAYYCSALPDQPANSMKGYHMAVIVWDVDKSFPDS